MIEREIVLPSPREDVWEALTEPERLEDWFANDVDLDLRPGGGARFRWSNGEERHAVVTEVEPERRLVFEWEDEGEVAFTLEDDPDGTRLTVVESSPSWSTALELRASALARADPTQGPVTPALAHLFTDKQGFGWLPEDDFVHHFAADVDPVKATVMYAVQQALAGPRLHGRDGRPGLEIPADLVPGGQRRRGDPARRRATVRQPHGGDHD